MNSFPFSLTIVLTCGVAGWMMGGSSLLEQTTATEPKITAQKAQGAQPRLLTTKEISKLTPAEFDAQLQAALRGSPGEDLDLLMAHWLRTDLAGAKAWLEQFPQTEARFYDATSKPLRALFRAWTQLDPDAALEAAFALSGNKAGTAKQSLVEGLMDVNPTTATRIVLSLDKKKEEIYGLGKLIGKLAKKDLSAAEKLAASLTGPMAAAALGAVGSVMAERDPQGALKWASDHAKASDLSQVLSSVLAKWAEKDPTAVGPHLLVKSPGQPDRFCTDAAATAIAKLGETDPAAAIKFAKDFFPQEHLKSSLGNLFWALIRTDGSQAGGASLLCQLVATLPPESLKDTRFFQSWPSDMKPSWDLLLQEPASPSRDYILGEMGKKMAGSDTANFLSLAMQLPDTPARMELLKSSLSDDGGFGSYYQFSKKDGFAANAQELRTAIDGLPAELKSLAASRLAWSSATGDPAYAAKILTEFPEAGKDPNLAMNLARMYAGAADHQQVQDWADSLTDAKAKAAAYQGICHEKSANGDIAEVAQWASEQPVGPARDGAAAALVSPLSQEDPEAAFAWAAAIQDEELAKSPLQSALKAWAIVDMEAAAEALERANLPAEQKAVLTVLLSTQK